MNSKTSSINAELEIIITAITSNLSTSKSILFIDLSFSAIDKKKSLNNYPNMKNQMMIRTNGNTTLPNGLAFNNSKDILGLLNQVLRNLYKSKAMKTAITPIII